jgi:hypothetical protein
MTNHRDWLSNKDKIEGARMLEWMSRADDERFIRHNHKSAELIAYSFERGMSRTQMVRIWGRKLVDAVIGPEITQSVKETKPDAKTGRT